MQKLPNHRWQIAPDQEELARDFADALGLSPLLTQVLLNRGVQTIAAAQEFLEPERQVLPSPLDEFPDLAISVTLLEEAIVQHQKIAICGDYDADGMTSTALLLRALRTLGATVDYAIPSRMTEGYGLNTRIVEDFHQEGVGLVLTVDNGIAAMEPVQRARELGLRVIITDHHDLPPQLPPADAILNPKLIRPTSPYRGVAGVGVAYILALSLAKSLGKTHDISSVLLELFTLGTIADLAPLTGVNRRWVRRGLQLLARSKIPGVQALVTVARLDGGKTTLKPEVVGFGLGPRINAVGRIGDPQVVIELLTTDDMAVALQRAEACEQINRHRQELCRQIEQEAIALYEASSINLQQTRVLLLVKAGWHHGVIGIVASRLVERYGVPVFIATYEGADQRHVRGSARSIPEFHVFEALEFCKDLLDRHGGHRAAGGFSLRAENLEALAARLQSFACQVLQPEHLRPPLVIDAQTSLNALTGQLVEQMDHLHPCGIDNPEPVFCSRDVQVIQQKIIGQDQAHLKVTLGQLVEPDPDVAIVDISGALPLSYPGRDRHLRTIQAIAWRWAEYYPLPERLDVAYRLRLNEWNGETSVQLELVSARSSSLETSSLEAHPSAAAFLKSPQPTGVPFEYQERPYHCYLRQSSQGRELSIWNGQGHELVIVQGQSQGRLIKPAIGDRPPEVQTINVKQAHFFHLIRAAMQALNLG